MSDTSSKSQKGICCIFWPVFGCCVLPMPIEIQSFYLMVIFPLKRVFCYILPQFCCFSSFSAFFASKCCKTILGPASRVRSTQTLVHIYNRHFWNIYFVFVLWLDDKLQFMIGIACPPTFLANSLSLYPSANPRTRVLKGR